MKSYGTPNWDMWKQIPVVKVWEASTLSLNFDPKQADDFKYTVIYDHSDPSNKHLNLIDERITILIRNLGANGLEIIDDNATNKNNFEINLKNFVSWALSMGWDIPPELAEMAAAQESSASKSIELNVPDGLDPSFAARLAIMIEVAEMYWKGVTPDNEKIPTNDQIAAEIENRSKNNPSTREISSTMADDMARIIRPDWAKDRRWPVRNKR